MKEKRHSPDATLFLANKESRGGIEEMAQAQASLEDLLRSTRIATVFLDANGLIQWFTPSAGEIYNLAATDIGRPLGEITHRLIELSPRPSIDEVSLSAEGVAEEIQTVDGRWYSRRALPILRSGETIGRIITFVDVTPQKQAAIRLDTQNRLSQILADAESFEDVVEDVLRSIRETIVAEFCALWLVDSRQNALYCGRYSVPQAHQMLVEFAERNSRRRFEFGQGLPGRVWKSKQPEWIVDLATDPAFRRKQAVKVGLQSGMAMPIVVGDVFYGVIELFTAARMAEDPLTMNMLRAIGTDIGKFVVKSDLVNQLRDEEARKTAILEAALDAIITMDVEGLIVDFNPAAERDFGVARHEVVGKRLAATIIPERFREAHEKGLRRFLRTGKSGLIGKRIETTGLRADGSEFPVEVAINAALQRNGQPFFTAHLRDISEQKAAENEARDRRERFETLVDATAQIVWSTDADGQVIEDSPSWRAFTGQSLEEWLGAGWLDAVHPEDRERTLKTWQEANRTMGAYSVEYRLRQVGSGYRWTQARGKPQIGADGKVIRWIGMNSDISDRKHRELSLAFTNNLHIELAGLMTESAIVSTAGSRIREFLNLSHLLFVAVDERRGIAVVQSDPGVAPAESCCGEYRLRDWFSESGITDLRHRNSIAIEDTGMGNAKMTSGGFAPLRIVSLLVTPCLSQGELSFLLMAVKPDPHCWQRHEVDLMRELSTQLYLRIERARAGSALQRNEERLAMALRAGGMAAWEWTPEKSYWTPEIYALLGLPESMEASSELLFRHVHPQDLDAMKAAWQKAVEGGDVYESEFRIIRPGGEVRWLAGIGQCIKDRSGAVTRIYGLNWDSTREHEAAQALRESERRAQQANRAKSEFLANMSHEIRTPMTAILGYAEILLRQESDAGNIEHLRTIIRNGNFLLEIINDILDLSRIEAGKLDVETSSLEPQAFIREIISLMQVRADEKGLQFEVSFQGEIPSRIQTDGRRLKQILVNLVGNAIKFTEKGGVRLNVFFVKEPRSQLAFEVVDTGIGIAEDQLSRLFQPFDQIDASVSRKFGGTGLGLVISRRLANILGGEITVASQPGKGSTFSFRIDAGDIKDASMVQPKTDPVVRSVDSGKELPRLSCRVLVVDDRRDVRFLTATILGKAGAVVEQAEDGERALERVQRSLEDTEPQIDLILLDMQMPQLDGYQTAAQLRKMGYRNPIIALTADAMQADMNRCLENGCNGYLSKPIDRALLITTISQYCCPSTAGPRED